jgi:hypothetical protein
VYCPSSDEPWPQNIEKPRHSGFLSPTDVPASVSKRAQAQPLASIIAACTGARHSRFVCIRQPPLAFVLGVAIGLILGFAMLAGLPAIVALPAADWSAVKEVC